MALYLIKRIREPGYDEYDSKVVRAATESKARTMASQNPGDEGSECWLDPIQSTCDVIADRGKPAVILESFNPG